MIHILKSYSVCKSQFDMLYLVEDGQTVVSKIQRLKGQTVITGI